MDFHCISVDLLGRNKSGQDYYIVNSFQSFMLYSVKFKIANKYHMTVLLMNLIWNEW